MFNVPTGRPPIRDVKPDRFSSDAWEKPKTDSGLKLIGDDQPADKCFKYVLADDSRRSYVGFLSGQISTEKCEKYFEQARDSTSWKQPDGAVGPIPRKTAWMVSKGCTCTYRYGSIEVEPVEYPQWMLELMQVAMPICGYTDEAEWPNSCNLNLYEDGAMSVGWHSDDEALFQGKFQDVRIISLSFGATRSFELRANWPEKDEAPLKPIMLGDGDFCTMEGMVQKHYQHRVPRENASVGARINLTWRWTVQHTAKCPLQRDRKD